MLDIARRVIEGRNLGGTLVFGARRAADKQEGG